VFALGTAVFAPARAGAGLGGAMRGGADGGREGEEGSGTKLIIILVE